MHTPSAREIGHVIQRPGKNAWLTMAGTSILQTGKSTISPNAAVTEASALLKRSWSIHRSIHPTGPARPRVQVSGPMHTPSAREIGHVIQRPGKNAWLTMAGTSILQTGKSTISPNAAVTGASARKVLMTSTAFDSARPA